MSKIAIVTGASRGIGREVCMELARQGHHIVAVARSEELLEKLAATKETIHAKPTDLTDEQAVHELVQEIEDHFPKVDILINNAGTLINKPFTDLSLADWRTHIEGNLISAVNITKQLLPLFNEKAHIVNISSMGGFQGSAKFPGLSAYSASKGAVSIFTESLAVELTSQNIKANALCLGAVQTEMLEEAFPGIEAPLSPQEMGNYIADFALNGHQYYNGKILPVAMDNPE